MPTNNRFSRGLFLASGAAAISVPAAAATGPLTTIRLAGTTDPDVVAVIWGAKNGIFEKRGLDVQVQRFNNGSAVSAAVVGGSIDIGKANIFSLMVAHLRSIPFVIESVAAMYSSENPTVAFVVAKNSTLTGGAGLNGKTIATAALGDIFSQVTSVWIDQNGGDSKTVKFVELPSSATPAAITAGRIDAGIMVDPLLTEAVRNENCKIIGRPYDIVAKRFGAAFYFCTQDYATKNADVLARFRAGLAEATKYALAHKREMIPVMVDYTGIERRLLDDVPLVIGSGIALDQVQPVIDFAARNKLIKNAFPAAELIDPAALRA
jgi:NitT/TauT family transport system substrate-binding protein